MGDIDRHGRLLLQVQARTTGANGEDFWGALSVPISVTTLDGTPSRPRNLGRTTRNETCISLMWVEPESPNGVIEKYEVSIRQIIESCG